FEIALFRMLFKRLKYTDEIFKAHKFA
ncbi:MAG: hypothetical protein K0R00_2898, partial [Herbinix sp.]|nr:hypothetical protein [Herbinix sp.]